MKPKFKEIEVGFIPEDWKIGPLKELCGKIGSGATPRGGSQVYVDNGVSFIRSQNVHDSGFKKDLVFINDSAAEKLKNVEVKKGDVLLNITGDSICRTSIVPDDVIPARVNQHVSILRPNSKLYNKYLFSYLCSYIAKWRLMSLDAGGTRKAITKGMLESFNIPLPSIEEQIKIGDFLDSFNRKIEINQKMNQTLEEMGQAIFKHWFVHFEFPNEEGKPYKSSGGEMVDSELGEIPRGWEVKKLSEICSKVIDGTHDSPSPEDEGYYLVTGRHIINGIIDFSKCYKISPEEHQKVMMRSKPEKGDTIFSNIGTLGTATFVDQDFEFSIKNVALFKPLKPIYSSFIYLYFLFPNTVKIMENSSSGTTQRFFSLKFLRGWELIKPSDEILLKFDNFIQPLLEMRTSLNAENKNLSRIRDSLLPKLMSGKIRVK